MPALVVTLLLFVVSLAQARIDGVTGQSFSLTAKSGKVTTADGSGLFFWGYANGAGIVQYPGPTMIVTQGQPVSVTLANDLNFPVSIVFPGQDVTVAVDPVTQKPGGVPGLLTREVLPGGAPVTYTFTPTEPGTYLYHSGTEPDLQVEMGLVGALIVRPAVAPMAGCDPIDPLKVMPTAYGDCRSAYDYEFLFLLTEMTPSIHELMEVGRRREVNTTETFPFSWFINGRGAPDTLAPAGASWLPNQPYNCFPQATPGDRVLLRVIGAGRDNHPFHLHGNNFDIIARDGRLLESLPGGASKPAEVGLVTDLAASNFTVNVQPGGTYDGIFAWTGRALGWDIYGAIDTTCTDANNDGMDDINVTMRCHDAACTDVNPADGFDDATREYCADHGTPFPVILPDIKDLAFGQFYSGSPFLGSAGALPPGEGGFNPNAGFAFMWHSHTEKELTNNNVFPGGLMTMFIVLPPGTPVE
jgi:FtsP/CotA-like multicopper oxidase with cupredoxin domain